MENKRETKNEQKNGEKGKTHHMNCEKLAGRLNFPTVIDRPKL